MKLPKAAPVSISIHYVAVPAQRRADARVRRPRARPGRGPRRPGRRRTRPPAGSPGCGRTRPGRRLAASIAHDAYGDATRWRAIAEANGIDDPLRLRRGTGADDPKAGPMSTTSEKHVALYSVLVDGERSTRSWRGACARSASRATCGCRTCARSRRRSRKASPARTSRSTSTRSRSARQLEIRLGAPTR